METLDNGNLLRGLLLLIKKDKNIWDHETRIFIKEGMKLGYDKEFCEDAIQNVLRNPNINQNSPVFFYRSNALKFLRFGISIIKEDVNPHPSKIQFLEKVAYENDLIRHWKTVGEKIITQIKSSVSNDPIGKIYE